MAWYVHWVRSGVTGSSLLSTNSNIGGVSGFRKSKSCSSCVIAYRTSVASFLHSRLFFSYLIKGFFFNDRSMAITPSTVRDKLSWFHKSGDEDQIRVERGNEHRSGLTTRKSAKYSTIDLTTSWSSASARRSSEDFFMTLLKSVSVRGRSIQQ